MNWISLLGLEAFVLRWRAAAIEGAMAVEDRVELARLEWQDQKRCMRQLLLLSIAVVALGVIAFILMSAALLVHFWDTPHRILVAWLVAGAWLLSWLGVVVALLGVFRQAGKAFALTRKELAQDWREIKEQL